MSSYHELMVPALFEKYAVQIIDEAKIEPGDKVLDIACGTGIVTCVAEVVKSDASVEFSLPVHLISYAKKLTIMDDDK